MLIVIAGFPSAFVGILFTGSVLVEIIFSLDGLGLLGFEATFNRDYPLMFGTLYFFSLLGLLMNLLMIHVGRDMKCRRLGMPTMAGFSTWYRSFRQTE